MPGGADLRLSTAARCLFQIIQQAGQVWFPDSAFKTAQAIRDFNREHLPLMIFANWRGFSSGMKGTQGTQVAVLCHQPSCSARGARPLSLFCLPDMYDEMLKFGAFIVDSLRDFKQPVLVYIPPHAELRGGSWVVMDPTINPLYVELYADKESRSASGFLQCELEQAGRSGRAAKSPNVETKPRWVFCPRFLGDKVA